MTPTPSSVQNVDIARAFEEMADLLAIQGANPFRIRAYRNAARLIADHGEPFARLVAEEADLTEFDGIGDDLAASIAELVQTGELEDLLALKAEVPPTLLDLMRLPGVGPKKAKKVWGELEVTTLEELREAAEAGRVAELDGFGEKTQQKILVAIEEYESREARFQISNADQYVEPLLEHLRAAPGVEDAAAAGSYRRRKETVGDIDLLCVADDGRAVIEHFTSWDRIARIEQAGETKASVVLDSGLQVDLRVVPERSYGAALVYFTGSKEHNIRLRQRALERELSISEYGVFDVSEVDADDEDGDGEWIAGRDEEEVYAAVDLPWIPPELREDRGEIAAAADDELPELIELGDIRGDLQMHSTWSDGKNSIEEMQEACRERGYEYLAVTDHSQALAMTGGLGRDKLERQWEEMAELDERHGDIRLLRSLEVDILTDGRLDLDDDLLARLDVVLVSVHSRFNLPAEKQTERVLTALEHPEVDILAHPTGRLINRRSGYELDLEAVLERAAELGVAVECNAQPDRLDLRDSHLMRASELGCGIVISTDAHSVANLALMRYGVEQARRAWLTRADVLNARSLDEFLAALRSGPSS